MILIVVVEKCIFPRRRSKFELRIDAADLLLDGIALQRMSWFAKIGLISNSGHEIE